MSTADAREQAIELAVKVIHAQNIGPTRTGLYVIARALADAGLLSLPPKDHQTPASVDEIHADAVEQNAALGAEVVKLRAERDALHHERDVACASIQEERLAEKKRADRAEAALIDANLDREHADEVRKQANERADGYNEAHRQTLERLRRTKAERDRAVADLASASEWRRKVLDVMGYDILALHHERDQLRRQVEACGACICDRNPATTDGPSETCPQHGRPYGYWVEGCETFAAQVEAVRALHSEHGHTGFPACAMIHGGGCAYDATCSTCHQPWPCPTIRALDGGGSGA